MLRWWGELSRSTPINTARRISPTGMLSPKTLPTSTPLCLQRLHLLSMSRHRRPSAQNSSGRYAIHSPIVRSWLRFQSYNSLLPSKRTAVLPNTPSSIASRLSHRLTPPSKPSPRSCSLACGPTVLFGRRPANNHPCPIRLANCISPPTTPPPTVLPSLPQRHILPDEPVTTEIYLLMHSRIHQQRTVLQTSVCAMQQFRQPTVFRSRQNN